MQARYDFTLRADRLVQLNVLKPRQGLRITPTLRGSILMLWSEPRAYIVPPESAFRAAKLYPRLVGNMR